MFNVAAGWSLNNQRQRNILHKNAVFNPVCDLRSELKSFNIYFFILPTKYRRALSSITFLAAKELREATVTTTPHWANLSALD